MFLFSPTIHRRGPGAACSFVVACLILDLGFAGYPSQTLAQERDRIADLEAELERARDAGNDAEVEEIKGLLRRLRAGSHSGDLPKPPFVIRCGPRSDEVFHRTEESDLAVLPDRRSRRSTDYGHVGGEGYRRWFHLIWGRPDAHLYAQGRVALRSYRLPLPRGEYYLGLGFCEAWHMLPGRRVFDVSVNGKTVLSDFDPVRAAGLDQAFRQMLHVQVLDKKGVEITFRSKRGEPLINNIWVYSANEKVEPSPPMNFRATSSYGAILLDWDASEHPAIAAYVVERRDGERDEFRQLFDNPIPLTRWCDRNVLKKAYQYRVRAVDVHGQTSSPSPPLTARPCDPDQSRLPRLSIDIAEESLQYLLGNPHEEREVRARFFLGDRGYPIEMRLRGASTRLPEKKSFRLRFLEDVPPDTRRVTYLKAEPQDFTLQREKLTCDVFAALGLPVSKARVVNLFINDEYRGVYLDIEPIRSPFKERAGLDPEGSLFRASSFQHLDAASHGELRGSKGDLAELREFIRRVNRVERGDFAEFVRKETDWPRLRDYLVASVLCHRSEIEADDSFYYRDPKSRRWIILPWDHNNGNFGLHGVSAHVSRPFMGIFGQSLQSVGHRHSYWYVLPSRIFNNAELRREYVDRLEELTIKYLLSGRVDAWIDDNFRRLRDDAPADPYRWPRQDARPFASSPGQLKRFVSQHASRIMDEVARERKRAPAAIVISEFQFGATEAWVELHNPSDSELSLEGYRIGGIESHFRLLSVGGTIRAGGYRVFEFPYRSFRGRAFKGSDEIAGDAEAIERRELEARKQRRRYFPGFSPDGGTLGLFAANPEWRRSDDDDRPEHRLIDWYFYGLQRPGYSYGRNSETFGFQKPSPGKDKP